MSRAFAALTALLVQLALVTAVTAAPGAPATAADTAPRDYIVVFNDSVDVDGQTFSLERAYGFVSRFRYSSALKGFAARFSPATASAIGRLPFVKAVEADGTARITGDPMAAGDSAPTGIRRMGGATTSVVHQAAGVAVAVIDTGIDLNHPDLNRFSGTNCINSRLPADDDHGHGTHVAGTIAARNNGSGVVGVAPGTPLYAVKVLDSNGSGSYSQIICGIDWVRANSNSKNIRVANMSLGGGGAPSSLRTAIQNATNAGVTFVVAAGNDGRNIAGSWSYSAFYPAVYPEVLTATAVGDSDGVGGGLGPSACNQTDDRYASFSNYSTSSRDNDHVIAAPGVCTYSTYPDGYATMSGTSMATPHVAGAVALCVSAGGACVGKTPSDIIKTMRTAAANKRSATPSYGFYGDPGNPSGSRYYGHMVWAGGDLSSPSAPPPSPDFSLSSSPTSRTITQGQQTTFSITVNPTNGFNSAVGLTVSGLPANATGSFNPTSTTTTSTLTIQTAANTSTGTFSLTVQGIGGSLTRTTNVSLTVNPAPTPDFSISAGAQGSSTQPGESTSYSVSITRTNGHAASVDLSTSGLPTGATGSFSPDPTTGASSQLTVSVGSNVAPGSYPFTITGTDGTLNRQTSATLVVSGTGSFTLSASPTSRSINRSSSTTYTINVNRIDGFGGSVAFTISGLPGGASASFSPTATAGSSSTLTVQTSSSTPGGTTTLTITGTSGSLVRTTTVRLTVNVPWYCVFGGC